jgi:sugar/nucleoside kinase (ribokinase family)
VTREQICQSTSKKLAAAKDLKSIKALVGFDGFVDSIIDVVDQRQSSEQYHCIKTIETFGKKILAAAGQSSNFELVTKLQKLGGNGPIMADALACCGLGVDYIGAVGHPAVHPVFEAFSKRANVIGVIEPGFTDALEFSDGKLMLGKYAHLNDLSWDVLVERVGRERLKKLVGGAQLIGMVNWTMLPCLSDIWEKMLTEMLPGTDRAGRHFFVDLADPEKRTRESLSHAMHLLTRLQEHIDVTLGVNLKESGQVAEVLGVAPKGDAEARIEQTAAAIRQKLGIACVVVHPRKGAAAATADHSASFAGPFVKEPKISTGAGDHFNAGFCVGRVLGMDLAECLCTGAGTSGHYVRTAASPSAAELAAFIARLPDPQ